MSAEEKIMESVKEDVSSQDTPQAITIHIMAPSNLETTSIDSALVASVEAQDARSEGESNSLLVVPSDGEDAISVSSKNILQTVTETHISEDLTVISNISSDHGNEQTIELGVKSAKKAVVEVIEEDIGCHCLICNEELEDDSMSVFKSFTTTSQRKISIFLGIVVGQKLSSRKVHSTIICDKCFQLLNKLDLLEVEIKTTKEEIVNKYQQTVTQYGGRARRKKPAAAKKSEYVFPKLEPDEDKDLEAEEDDIYEPKLEDLIEEEHDQREDRESVDEEWEPDVKRAKVKRELSNPDPAGPPKRKRGRPRKDAAKPKGQVMHAKDGFAGEKDDEDKYLGLMTHVKDGLAGGKEDEDKYLGHTSCPVCKVQFSFPSQVRRHVRHEHPDFDARKLLHTSVVFPPKKDLDAMHLEVNEDASLEEQQLVYNLDCSWCDLEFTSKEEYDQHLKQKGEDTYSKYIEILQEYKIVILGETSSDDTTDKLSTEQVAKVTKGEVLEKCSVCDFVTKTKETMEAHFDSNHKDASRTCWLCSQKCAGANSLRDHLIHHFYGVKLCPLCPIKFSTRHHLISHLNIYHTNCCITCKECNKGYETYHLYEIHVMNDHSKNGTKLCKLCKKNILIFDYYKHLEEHGIPGINRRGPHLCNLCSERFEFTAHLCFHKDHKHPEAYSFKCDECERGCRTEQLLSLHKWGHKYGAHSCPACRLKFRQVDQLKKHLLVAHPDQEGFTCKYCPLTLKNYATYIAHCKFKHPKESGYNRPVKCKICSKLFDHKIQLKYHMRNHKSQELQTCKVCGISVKNLDIHMNLHTKSKKFVCSICGAVYHNKASFHFHMKRVHMGLEVRKHLCGICGKKFLTAADQRIHYSRVHQGERKYWCSVCEKGYKSKASLTYHERLHTGEKPHKCTLCDRTFRVPSYLQRHMEHDHRTQYKGVYFKQGRPKSQDARGQMRRKSQGACSQMGRSCSNTNGSIPEIVQITVPMEMGREVVAAVNSVQSVQNPHYSSEQEGVVYVVCDKLAEQSI